MVNTFHRAAQYLATVAKSFLNPKDDDSHTNLDWESKGLHTHPLSYQNDVLTLDYTSFSLIWINNNGFNKSILLDGRSHSEIISWVENTAKASGIEKPYSYSLHYKLPYNEITDDYIFIKPNSETINVLINQRELVQRSIQNILMKNEQNTPIRIWPHHFDSGSFFMTKGNIGIGIGMAVPDSMIDDFYLYVSGYKNHDSIKLSNTLEIKHGHYYNDGWKGIALPVKGINENSAINFYQDAINLYKNHSL